MAAHMAAPMSRMESPGVTTWALLGLLGIIWGGAFFLARIAVAEVPPLLLVFLRVSIAALALHAWLAVQGRSIWPYLDRWRAFLGIGLLNNAIPFSLLFVGQTQLSAGLASILNASTPIWTVLIAHVATRDERMRPATVAGVGLGFAGVATMLGPAAFAQDGSAVSGVTVAVGVAGATPPAWAMLCVLAGAASYALASIFGKRFKGVPPRVTATGQLTASTLVMAPAALLVHGWPDWGSIGGSTWLAVLLLAIVSTACAYILFFAVLARAGAVNVSLVTLLVPVSAILLGWLFLGERLSPTAWLGLALIALGLLVLDGRPARLALRTIGRKSR